MSEHPPDGITAEEWTATPPTVRVLVRAVQQQVTLLEQRVRVLEDLAYGVSHEVTPWLWWM